ncbi:MAG: hypothetical protein P8P74_00760 [Crocinitomicaceae bacterium]|nr:hypothetical protein [Crocinitomicaceae bacterium]
MKSERISIFNYEAFYLDHLEGNLGEEDTALLLAFLEEHPDLFEEEGDFVMLDATVDAPTFDDKDSLKIVSDEAGIVLSNVEHFLIAESEGQLPVAKQEELNAFVAQHPHLEKERKYLAAMFLKADQSIVYAEKSGLKRKGAVIFWPYIALAAASILIAFFFVMNNDPKTDEFAENPNTIEKNEDQKQERPVVEKDNIQLVNNVVHENSTPEQDTENSSPSPRVNVSPSNTPNRQAIASVNSIKHRQARRVINSIGNADLQPVASKIDPPALTAIPENDYAQASAGAESYQMKNPIKPITSRLEKTLNTDVDFKTGKAANNTGAGFFLKIGKFELSRKKGKRSKK